MGNKQSPGWDDENNVLFEFSNEHNGHGLVFYKLND